MTGVKVNTSVSDAASSLRLGKIGHLESKVDGEFNIKRVNCKVGSVQDGVAVLNLRRNDIEQDKLSNILEK